MLLIPRFFLNLKTKFNFLVLLMKGVEMVLKCGTSVKYMKNLPNNP